MTTDRELMRRVWEFFSHYILVNEMAQERLDAEAETILEALRARLAQPEELELPKVRLEEFLKLIEGKENFRGIPTMRTEWPTREET